jgi:23S rRNA pseudouridine1911/1915/1917 synthase
LRGQSIALNIKFEDKDLIVLEKPPGLVVHPAPGNPDRTLVNALIAHCGESLSGIGGEMRPGIVHRLDKNTSGLMLVAKNDYSHNFLSEQFANHTLDRAYYAIVWGTINSKQGVVSGNIGRNPKNRKKMAVVERGGKSARTTYNRVKSLGDWASLVECKLETGRTHQIRVHMASIGHPVVCDSLYGGSIKVAIKKKAPEFCGRASALNRHALHAYLLGFTHPRTRKRLRFATKLPKDIKGLL